MEKVGYVRVSSDAQSEARQEPSLLAYTVELIANILIVGESVPMI
jgi:DNA invertase Pin-like site-specific DNA recombinase